jgi:dihydrodipicolinate synthase/N-acetylneuraminate lyase
MGTSAQEVRGLMGKQVAGVCPVVAVPFLADGTVDLDGFATLVDHLLGTGASTLTLFGLASEFHKLDDAERDALSATLLRSTVGHPRVGALVSVTDHATEVAVRRARGYVAAGADALMVLPPFFLSPGRGAVVAHLDAVLDAVAVPVVVQYAPSQTGWAAEPGLWAQLRARHANLQLVKVEAQPPGRYIAALRAASGGTLGALVGYAGVQLPDALRRGAVGVQPGCSFTELYVELLRLWDAGDDAGFTALHQRMLPYLSYWMQHVELVVQAEKTILRRRGLIAHDRCRRPGYDLDKGEQAMIDGFLEEFRDLLEPGRRPGRA